MTEKTGAIYILTNPSFPDYVKIGYARDIEQRLSQLNQSECIPYAFRVYAIYETTAPLQDKKLHALIDQLNPELRSVEEFDGKKRIKEFYAVSAEDAYNILEAIAEISGTQNRLKRMKPEGHEIIDKERAEESENAYNESVPSHLSSAIYQLALKSNFLIIRKSKQKLLAPKKLNIRVKLDPHLVLLKYYWALNIHYKALNIGHIKEEHCATFVWNLKNKDAMTEVNSETNA